MSSNTPTPGSVPRSARNWRGGSRRGRGGARASPYAGHVQQGSLSTTATTGTVATVATTSTIGASMVSARAFSMSATVASSTTVQVAGVERSAAPSPTGTIGRHFSERRFADAPISAASKAGLQHEFLSDVQAATLDLALSGKDLLVQAKTGTGKTLAFLLPAIERLLKEPKKSQGISILVLSPTRELALQIEKEAKMLLKHHTFAVQHTIGGTNITTEATRLSSSPCDVLIATPGRLLDHLGSSTNLSSKLRSLKTIVYDEADRLLDQGFKNDLDKILDYLPPKDTRQALLFSATVSEEIKKVAKGALRPGYEFVSTLGEEETNTHEHVDQTYIVTPQANFLQVALGIIQADLSTHASASKVIIFFPTARQVSFAAEVFEQLQILAAKMNFPIHQEILEIHSRKSQPARIKAAETFKKARSAVLLSSDVAARGMDFPGVTLVVQLGLPASTEQYIHRLGRTGRAGKQGQGIVVLSPEEQFFLRDLKREGVVLEPASPQLPPPPSSSTSAPANTALRTALASISPKTKTQAYCAFLGYYNGYTGKRYMSISKEALVALAGEYAAGALGWSEANYLATAEGRPGGAVSGLIGQSAPPPPVDRKVVGKMGLKGVSGLRIVSEDRPPRGGAGAPGGGPRRNDAPRERLTATMGGGGSSSRGGDGNGGGARGGGTRGGGARRGGW